MTLSTKGTKPFINCLYFLLMSNALLIAQFMPNITQNGLWLLLCCCLLPLLVTSTLKVNRLWLTREGLCLALMLLVGCNMPHLAIAQLALQISGKCLAPR